MKTLTLLLLLCTNLVNASTLPNANNKNELVVTTSASYVLGDNDTRLVARDIALNQAKQKASELVGTQVKTSLTIEGDKVLKDQITVIASSFMTTEIIKEDMTTSKDGRSVMNLTIRAHLDKTALNSKLEGYSKDSKKQEDISNIQAENQRLQEELALLTEELKTNQNNKTSDSLISRRSAVLSSLQNNEIKINKVFEPGYLFGLINQQEINDTYYKNYVKNEINEFIKTHLNINISTPQIIKIEKTDALYNWCDFKSRFSSDRMSQSCFDQSKGTPLDLNDNLYDVKIFISWSLSEKDSNELSKRVAKLQKIYSSFGYYKPNGDKDELEGFYISYWGHKIKDYISSQIYINYKIGNIKNNINITNEDKKQITNADKKQCIFKGTKTLTDFHKIYRLNSLILNDLNNDNDGNDTRLILSEAQLKNISKIETEVVIKDEN